MKQSAEKKSIKHFNGGATTMALINRNKAMAKHIYVSFFGGYIIQIGLTFNIAVN